jgi:hypothetical protein
MLSLTTEETEVKMPLSPPPLLLAALQGPLVKVLAAAFEASYNTQTYIQEFINATVVMKKVDEGPGRERSGLSASAGKCQAVLSCNECKEPRMRCSPSKHPRNVIELVYRASAPQAWA